MTDIVVDSSALIAILIGEPERDRFLRTIGDAGDRAVSSFSLLESSVVLGRRLGDPAWARMDQLLELLGIRQVPVDAQVLEAARRAWLRYGKGRHPACLNLGDCCSFATAEVLSRPLLCKGNDFEQTPLPLVKW